MLLDDDGILVSLDDFPSCCGASILHDFRFGRVHDRVKRWHKVLGRAERNSRHNDQKVMFAITTSNPDYIRLNKTLKARGWRVRERTVNPNSGRTLIVWIKTLRM